MTTPRLSGPCSHGDHHYCLGPLMILPCACDCHEHTDPEQETPVTIPDEAVAAAAKAMYEQPPRPQAWRRGQYAAARAVLEAAIPWLQAAQHIEHGGDQ